MNDQSAIPGTHKVGAPSAIRHPTISLCMIVRDEEGQLPRCLASVKDLVDEIIVVDTGSKDKTIQIARSFGAKVYEHPWQNDFSAARNISLSYAQSDWILILDADEELEKDDIPKIRPILMTHKCEGLTFAVSSQLPGSGKSRHDSIRLFKNHKEYHYQGIVHNQLIIKGLILTTDVRLYHHGYNLSPGQMRKKLERSLPLLKEHLHHHPDDLYARFQLARLYRGYNYYEECIKEGLMVLNAPQAKEEGAKATVLMTMCDLALAYFKLGDYQHGEEYCLKALSQKEDYLDVLFILGNIYLHREEYQKGIDTLKRFLTAREKSGRFDPFMVDNVGQVDQVYLYLGKAYILLSQFEEAIDYLKHGLEFNPLNPAVYHHLVHCYQRIGNSPEAKSTCLEAISKGIADEAIYFQLALIYKDEGKHSQAKEAFLEVVNLKEDHLAARLFLIELYLSEGEIAPVFLHLKKAEEIDPAKAWPVYKTLGNKCVSLGRYEDAVQAYKTFLRYRPSDEEGRLNLARLLLKLQQYQEAKEHYGCILQLNPAHSEARRFLSILDKGR
ncbi:MAG: tetratricopeptide repeat protein [bacterium]